MTNRTANAIDRLSGLTPSEAASIVKDLVGKYPRGPKRRQLPEDYARTTVWSHHYNREIETWVLKRDPGVMTRCGLTPVTVEFCGYDPVQLYRLGAKSQQEAEDLIHLSGDVQTRHSLTRRSRRLWRRLESAVSHVQRCGTAGIWLVSSSDVEWNNPWRQGMPIWASTAAEAEAQARIVGPTGGLVANARLGVTFDRLGTPREAVEDAATKVNSRINRLKERIVALESDLSGCRSQLAEEMDRASRMMGGIMLLSVDGHEDGETEEVQQ